MDDYLTHLETEGVNPETTDIDSCTTEQMTALMNAQDMLVAKAVGAENANIAKAVDIIYECLKAGGRLIYIGAGTSGRLGVLDASECPPTFGVCPDMVQGYIAGGDGALRNSAEGCEDDGAAGIALIDSLDIGEHDAVVGISASGSAQYVICAMRRTKERGGRAIALCTNKNTKLAAECEVAIAPLVGSEVISGSTRLKSGTAQKMVLNMLSTCAMIKLGKVYGNLMVDLRATNKKLRDRAQRLFIHATGADRETAAAQLDAADGHVKLAILMHKTGVGSETGKALLNKAEGHLAKAIDYAKESCGNAVGN